MVTKRNYTIPLRKEFQKAPKYRRSKKAVQGVIEFLQKHMKSDEVKIGKHLNEKIWEHGIRNPPHKVEVVTVKGDDGVVKAELVGFEKELEEKKAEKADTKKQKAEDSSKKEKTESLEQSVETKEEPKPKAEQSSKDQPKTKKKSE